MVTGSTNRIRRMLAEKGGPVVQPSILDCDFSRLADVMADAEAAGVRMFHFDVMDGHFVPNLSYGPPVIRCLRPRSKLPFDCHLMISNPEKYIDAYCDAGADNVTIHAEVTANPRPLVERIHNRGALAGIAINPPTPVEQIAGVLDVIDLVLVMSVMPGFGGQKFQTSVLDKFRWLRKHGPKHLLLESDGGVNRDTIPALRDSGCDLFVVGSALFRAPNFQEEFRLLQSLANRQPERGADSGSV